MLLLLFYISIYNLCYFIADFLGNGTTYHQPGIVVRAEEALIVIMVLALWIAAIALFFNRWGKIRMLEPYQPKFIQQHRPSCPLVDQNLMQVFFIFLYLSHVKMSEKI